MRKTADTLDKIRETIVGAYTARTGIDRDEVIAMMDAETWMSAGDAKARGFADVVKPAKQKATRTGPRAASTRRRSERA
jgi:ATP-dependent protease ClpP protease subunit